MAMIPCPECQQPVSELAPSCPNCGRPIAPPVPAAPPQVVVMPPKPKHGCLKVGCGILAVLFLIVLIIGIVADGPKKGSRATSSSAAKSETSGTPEPAAAAQGAQWSYSHDEDAMAKGTVHQAIVRSTNTVSFDFPYAGPQHGTLTLRTHPRYGRDVALSIEKGQFQCPSYQACTVLVRFDDQPAVQYTGVGPEDNSTETVFLRDYNGFVAKMLKAKKVRISANIFQEGAPVFEFDVSGFDPARYRPKQ